MATNKIDKSIAIEQLWRRAHLSWLLAPEQKILYELFHNNPAKIQTWLLSRRFGKTYSLCVLAIEYCLKNPRSIIKYVAPTNKQVERFIRPIITEILEKGCPSDIKPEYNKKDSIYFFPNGSEIQLCGAENGNIDSIRGGFAHIAIVDESQDVSGLKYAINSVLLPTTLTTRGKVLMAGTPPQDSDHEFIELIEKAEADKTLIIKTIYDNSRLTKEDIQLQIEAMGGEDSEGFQREYLCKIIKSKDRSVVPEATPEKMAAIVKDWIKPAFYDSYTSMDIGLSDWTVVLFGYYDFRSDKVIIEDELVAYGQEMYLPILAKDIEEKEKSLWTNQQTYEFRKPKKRVSDHNLIAINEIKKFSQYRLLFDLADKNDKHASLNNLRTLLGSNKIIIHPRCETLIRHLKNVKWKSINNKDTYARCPFGSHYDGVDALAYMLRAIDFKNNPYPKNYEMKIDYSSSSDGRFTPNSNSYGTPPPNADVYRKILNLRKPK